MVLGYLIWLILFTCLDYIFDKIKYSRIFDVHGYSFDGDVLHTSYNDISCFHDDSYMDDLYMVLWLLTPYFHVYGVHVCFTLYSMYRMWLREGVVVTC